ncbi:oligosaccharide flippase family protein [Haloferacaceae archaeon DSL9]
MSLAGKLSTDALVTTLVKLSLKIRGLLVIPLLTIFLGAAEYGAYVQVFAIATLLGQVAALGLDTGIVQFVQQYDDDRTETYWTITAAMAATGLVVMALIAATAPLFSAYTLGTRAFADVFVVGAALVPLTIGFRLGQGYLRATRRIKLYSATDAAEVYLHVIGVVVVVFLTDWGIVGVMGSVVATRALVVCSIHAGIVREIGVTAPSLDRLSRYLGYSLATMGTDVARSMLTRTDRVLVGYFLGASAVGVYSVAYQTAYVMMLYVRPLSITLFPEFSRLWNTDRERVRTLTVSGLRYFFALAVPSIGGFWLIGADVLGLLTTPDVAAAAAPLLVLIAIGILLEGLSEIYTQLFYAANATRVPLLIQGGAALVNVGLNAALLPIFGIAGAAVATILTFALAAGATAGGFQRWFRVVPPSRAVLAPLVGTAAMIAVFRVVEPSWVLTLALAPPLYGAVFVLAGGIDRDELRFLLGRVAPAS